MSHLSSLVSLSLSSSACHNSCASCSGPTGSHCTACVQPWALRQGHCLSSCGEGFYPDHGLCKGTVGVLAILKRLSHQKEVTFQDTFPLQFIFCGYVYTFCAFFIFSSLPRNNLKKKLCWNICDVAPEIHDFSGHP